MYKNDIVTLRKAVESDKLQLHHLLTTDEEWTKFDGPYFPYERPTLAEFEKHIFARLQEGRNALVIDVDGKAIGTVTAYWEDEATRWLEAGIVIYSHQHWSKGIGRLALVPWITHLFEMLEIERVGMTTWSGNPRMISCAKSIGLQVEGILRKVRYHQGQYFDSVKLGVLREEWFSQLDDLTKPATRNHQGNQVAPVDVRGQSLNNFVMEKCN